MNVTEVFTRGMYPLSDTQMYGLEIEVENCQWGCVPSTPDSAWSVTTDGSLRNHGREFLTTPLTRVKTGEHIAQYYEWHHGNEFETSHRTGIHVHADMRNYSVAQVTGILTAYAILEPLLYVYVGAAREQNIYCIPWYRAPQDAALWASCIARGGFRELQYDACKYTGLYIEPLFRFGTLEFRHAPTWDTPEPLYGWVEIIDRLIRYGVSKTADDIMADLYRLGEQDFASHVLGEMVEGMDAEDLIDSCDSVNTAELLVVTGGSWVTSSGEGGEALGYWNSRVRPMSFDDIVRADREHDDNYDEYDDEEH